MSRQRNSLRFIYGDEAIPTFDTPHEAKNWVRTNVHGGSNPDFPGLQHLVSILVTEEQIQDHLLSERKRIHTRGLEPNEVREPLANNLYKSDDSTYKSISNEIDSRLGLEFHSILNESSVQNTLNYLFHHMRCGIYVKIAQNRLDMFVPFANIDYQNDWSEELGMDQKALDKYYSEKLRSFRKENILSTHKWWANGNIICNEMSKNVWGEHLTIQLRDLLIQVCSERQIPDMEFFINKRDFPQLKCDLSEPYDFIYRNSPAPLKAYKYSTYSPIVSFFCSPEFADLPFVSADDWEIMTGRIFPPKGGDNYSSAKQKDYVCAWEDRIATAFFRGSGTGGGVTIKDNQRLRLADISYAWRSDPRYNNRNPIDGVAFLDAGVVTWNIRDKKMPGGPMTYLRESDFKFKTVGRVPMYEQVRYKYLVYVEGHCAAARFGFLLKVGCVILKVESVCVPSQLWFFPALKAYEHFVPVKADMSDLAEKIEWCKTHDSECRTIASNAQKLYAQLFSRKPLLDYLQYMFCRIHQNSSTKRSLIERFPGSIEPCEHFESYPVTRDDAYIFEYFLDKHVFTPVPLTIDDIQRKVANTVLVPMGKSVLNIFLIDKNGFFCYNTVTKQTAKFPVTFMQRKNPGEHIKTCVGLGYFLEYSPVKFQVVDFVRFNGMRIKADYSIRLKMAEVELCTPKFLGDMSFTLSVGIPVSHTKLATFSNTSEFYRGFCLMAKGDEPRGFIFEWFGSTNLDSLSFTLSSPDFVFAESPIPPPVFAHIDYTSPMQIKSEYRYLANQECISRERLIQAYQ